MKLKTLILTSIYLLSPMSHAEEVPTPSGLRPCCAFGINMKSELGVIPVPFFKVKNIVETKELATHRYNDGSQSITSSLVGSGDEANGLIYTSYGGIIDTAHVRDTADNTFYLFSEIRGNLGTYKSIELDDELRHRVVTLQSAPVNMMAKDKLAIEIKLSGLLAFRLAQWHEVAQWFGFTSVAGFKEYPSAYSPEDLYSNMLGSLITIEVLENNPNATKDEYQHLFSTIFLRRLDELGAQDAKKTEEVMNGLDGYWWDSHKRLPDKWVVKTRDYQPRLTLKPHWGEEATKITLSLEAFSELEVWGNATFTASKKEKHFNKLPDKLKQKAVWSIQDLEYIAAYAKAVDDKNDLSNNQLLDAQ
ncbi:hypothetical protein BCU68_12340 [Vibrio sp. 10N.286.49.B3]|uniref:DUF4056 domain-containing protein n=1 Tax=Vibrio sp. 10N.286.49.B3 TaxID=1880855 RepID=UPI000C82C7BB|nr:DUF4056 domain-containing protein [Vibrio sp. 10N.286.49.B3]PMH44631.1 hypothetical protein BCU68_12340 [Vibrio sp. 10N.286.49.B3]